MAYATKEKLQVYLRGYYLRNKERLHLAYLDNLEKRRADDRVRTKKLRREVLDHYGHRCACCGEEREIFLCMDHINEDGATHRKEIGFQNHGGAPTYRWLRKNNYPSGFQVLCFNCNMAKHLGGCPHQQEQAQKALGVGEFAGSVYNNCGH